MSYLSLLQRQIKKYFKQDIQDPALKDLLDAINRSYEHYERDHQLGLKSLEISSQELRQMAQDKADKETWLRAILNAASDGILVLDSSNTILESNTQAQLCFDNTELNGKNIDALPILSKNVSLKDILEKEDPKELFELTIELYGHVSYLELSFSPLVINGKKLKICILRDISRRRFTEKVLSLRHKVTHLLLNAASYHVIFPKILEVLCEELGWDSACFWENDKEPIRVSKNSNLTLFNRTIKKPLLPGILEPAYKNQEDHLPSVVGFPVFYEKQIYGVIELYSDKNKISDDVDIKIKQDIGGEIGLFIDRYKAREREIAIQGQLVTAAQQAGMCQVATSVLHNVGNILNSVNISSTVLLTGLQKSEMNNLKELSSLLEKNKDNLANFLTSDAKGKLIPQFIASLSKEWEREQEQFVSEAKILSENILGIKSIIKMQQSMSSVLSILEDISIDQVINDILAMQKRSIEAKKVNVIKELGNIPPSQIDKARMSQILLNLINNALDAMEKSSVKNLMITSRLDENDIEVSIRDTGVGILPEVKDKIFDFGFTTKKEGHGFGLHSAINAVKEMGGELKFKSDGANKGVVFCLRIPFKQAAHVVSL